MNARQRWQHSEPWGAAGVWMRLALVSVLVKTSEMKCCDFSYRVLTEEQNKADDLAQNGLHLLVTALANSRERHQTSMPVLPIGWGEIKHYEQKSHFYKCNPIKNPDASTHGSATSAWCAVWSWEGRSFLRGHMQSCPERFHPQRHYWTPAETRVKLHL